MDSIILCGMQFGDEGKGTFVDYLAYERDIDCIVRYNGGSQASHTVITPSGTLHKFSQLGSGMFSDKCHTYLTENMVINLDNLMVEAEVFSEQTGIPVPRITDRIHIHENCYTVTPYHKLINKLRELSVAEGARRGTVGTGVSEVKRLLAESERYPYDPPLGLRVGDIFDPHGDDAVIGSLEALQGYVQQLYRENETTIWRHVPEIMRESLKKEIAFLSEPEAFADMAASYIFRFRQAPPAVNFSERIYDTYAQSLRGRCRSAVFEGAQGLLIDGSYGIKPNTTFLDTTNRFALDISGADDTVTKVGIIKAFASRHGFGVFPTETTEVSDRICDKNQEESFWNGGIRFGWFDAVLFRYAQSIDRVDELYLSSLDKLDDFESISVCDSYYYHGTADERFASVFSFRTLSDGRIVITDIKKYSDDLGAYLAKCTPSYITVKGWRSDISDATDKASLPTDCTAYIALLEKLTGLPITLVSVGATRENKIRM